MSAQSPRLIEWLPGVPNHWTVERGRFIFRQVTLPPEPNDGVVTVFRDGQVTLRENRRADGFMVALQELGYQRVRKGDLVIHGMDAFAGAIGVSESTGKCTPEYSVLEPLRPGFSNSYYARCLRVMAWQNFIYVICPSVRERAPRFRFETFKDVLLPVPPADEQQRIAAFLDRKTGSIDALIAKKERLIELLQEKRKALITHAVTQGVDPNVPMNSTGSPWFGLMPKHWRLVGLRHLLSGIEQGWSPTCDSIPAGVEAWGVLKAGCTANGIYRSSENKALLPSDEPRPSIEVQPGDLVMSRASGSRHIVGSCAIVTASASRLMLSDKHFRLKPDTQRIDRTFLCLALASHPGRSQIELSISGAEGLANNLPQSELRKVVLAVPPLIEQQRIAEAALRQLRHLDKSVDLEERSVEKLHEYRQALITAVVTGEIDVSKEAA